MIIELFLHRIYFLRKTPRKAVKNLPKRERSKLHSLKFEDRSRRYRPNLIKLKTIPFIDFKSQVPDSLFETCYNENALQSRSVLFRLDFTLYWFVFPGATLSNDGGEDSRNEVGSMITFAECLIDLSRIPTNSGTESRSG